MIARPWLIMWQHDAFLVSALLYLSVNIRRYYSALTTNMVKNTDNKRLLTRLYINRYNKPACIKI